jgi:hypothetical protein
LTLSKQDKSEILKALLNYAKSNNEEIPEKTVLAWIDNFSEMGLTSIEIIKVIEKSKFTKKFGATKFSDFADILLEENQLFSKAEMISKAREMAIAIYQTKYKMLIDKLEREKTANEETRLSMEQVNKFFANIQERQKQVAEEINKVLDTIKRKCSEKFDNYEMFTLNKILDAERKLP